KRISAQSNLLNTKEISPKLIRTLTAVISCFLSFGFTDKYFSNVVRAFLLGFKISPHLQIYDNSGCEKLNSNKEQHNTQNKQWSVPNIFSKTEFHNHQIHQNQSADCK